jgi:transposase InsO family protein
MREMGLRGVVRGKKVITTNPDQAQSCPDDRVNRKFKAERPNQLWVSDLTYVSTWSGMVYVAFVRCTGPSTFLLGASSAGGSQLQ